MDVGGLEHRANPLARTIEVAERTAKHRGPSRVRPHEPEHGPQRGGLAGAVRPEEAGHEAGLRLEAELGDRLRLAEALAEGRDLDQRSVAT